MNFAPTEEQALIQESARRFATTELAPIAGELEEPSARPRYLAVLKQLAELGFMGLNVSPQYGGTGAGVVAFRLHAGPSAKTSLKFREHAFREPVAGVFLKRGGVGVLRRGRKPAGEVFLRGQAAGRIVGQRGGGAFARQAGRV